MPWSRTVLTVETICFDGSHTHSLDARSAALNRMTGDSSCANFFGRGLLMAKKDALPTAAQLTKRAAKSIRDNRQARELLHLRMHEFENRNLDWETKRLIELNRASSTIHSASRD